MTRPSISFAGMDILIEYIPLNQYTTCRDISCLHNGKDESANMIEKCAETYTRLT